MHNHLNSKSQWIVAIMLAIAEMIHYISLVSQFVVIFLIIYKVIHGNHGTN